VSATDSEGRRLSGILRRCVSESPDEVIYVDLKTLDPGFSPYGRLRISDPGSDAVISSEETLLRELGFSLSSGQKETAALQAWHMLEPCLGSDPLRRRSSAKLFYGEMRYVAAGEAVDDSFDQATQMVDARLYEGVGIKLLTGAPGTGKTRVAARIASDHLASVAADGYPPCRVLIVAASHFAIDNFLRTFLRLSPPDPNIFRNVPQLRIDLLKNRRVVDADLHERLTKGLERQKWALPKPNPRKSNKVAISEYAALLRSEIQAAERTHADLKAVEGKERGSPLIPSHEQWRKLYGGGSTWRLPIEAESKTRYLRNRLVDLEGFKDVGEESAEQDTYAGESLYLQLGCDVIATTPDAFNRLPDMSYSLVVFEEASQLGSLKILKVLTKVIRACSAAPRILMSGDTQQLPPFVDSYSEAGESADPDIDLQIEDSRREAELLREFRTKETPFERMCARNEVINLEVQHRMHPDIATLINSLFYSDQCWTSMRRGPEGGVEWANTHALHPRALTEENGTSRYNLEEKEVINVIVRDWIRPGRSILVVSPYSAQVSTLMASIDRRISVRTIDGCQGVEADVVIVSFVSFNFTETRDFVIDPGRMNVALSRARDVLYLVGDLDELRRNVERLRDGHPYGHLQGLAELFGESGHFRNCVRDWHYGNDADTPR
jgi:hypothetical protein